MGSEGTRVLVQIVQLPPDTLLGMARRDVPRIGILVHRSRDHRAKTTAELVPAMRQMADSLRMTWPLSPLCIEIIVVTVDQLAITALDHVLPEDQRYNTAILGNP